MREKNMTFLAVISLLTLLFTLNYVGAIMNGKTANPGEFQYQVLLKAIEGNDQTTCGGAIIDELHVLTAWHCIEDINMKNIDVIVGAVKYENDPNGVLHRIRKIHLHESRACNPDDERCYDIAVLTLNKPIEYSDTVNEIPLPTSDITIGDECIFAGWGVMERNPDAESSTELKYGYGKIRSRSYCLKKFWVLRDYEFCFQSPKNDPATVQWGDSGTPLVCNGVLTGIVIRSTGQPRDPVIAIDVYKVLNFILNIRDATFCTLL